MKSILERRFFMGMCIPLNKLLNFLYLFVCDALTNVMQSYFGWSTATVMEWMQFMLQLIGKIVLMNEHHYAIGGPGIEVEINELKFGKRKYNCGHQVEGIWVFGGVKRTPERKAKCQIGQDKHSSSTLKSSSSWAPSF
jgi:hypothetical protein